MTSTSFAYENANLEDSQMLKKITLRMSTDPEDYVIMNRHLDSSSEKLDFDRNVLTIDSIKFVEQEDTAIISGVVNVILQGEEYAFSIDNKPLEIVTIEGCKLYKGTIEEKINNNFDILLNCTFPSDFKEGVVNLTLVDMNDGSQEIFLFGEHINEQDALAKYMMETVVTEEFEMQQNITEDYPSIMEINETDNEITSGFAYQHVTNKSNSFLGNVERTKQLMVMNICKCDSTNFGSGSNNYEMIRIFTRAYNIPRVEDGAVQGIPIKVYVNFQTNSPYIFGVSQTKPSSTSGALDTFFDVFTSVVGTMVAGKLAVVNAVISSLPIRIGDSITKTDNSATFNISTRDISISNFNLPSGTNSSDAESDESHGICFKVLYTQDAVHGVTAPITVSSYVTYQVLYENDTAVSMRTGTATVTHNVNLK